MTHENPAGDRRSSRPRGAMTPGQMTALLARVTEGYDPAALVGHGFDFESAQAAAEEFLIHAEDCGVFADLIEPLPGVMLFGDCDEQGALCLLAFDARVGGVTLPMRTDLFDLRDLYEDGASGEDAAASLIEGWRAQIAGCLALLDGALAAA